MEYHRRHKRWQNMQGGAKYGDVITHPAVSSVVQFSHLYYMWMPFFWWLINILSGFIWMWSTWSPFFLTWCSLWCWTEENGTYDILNGGPPMEAWGLSPAYQWLESHNAIFDFSVIGESSYGVSGKPSAVLSRWRRCAWNGIHSAGILDIYVHHLPFFGKTHKCGLSLFNLVYCLICMFRCFYMSLISAAHLVYSNKMFIVHTGFLGRSPCICRLYMASQTSSIQIRWAVWPPDCPGRFSECRNWYLLRRGRPRSAGSIHRLWWPSTRSSALGSLMASSPPLQPEQNIQGMW